MFVGGNEEICSNNLDNTNLTQTDSVVKFRPDLSDFLWFCPAAE